MARSRLSRLARWRHRTPPDPGPYDGRYYGAGRNPLDRMGLSGYERYDRTSSNAEAAAYLLWRFLSPRRSLDVGCALGYVVEALRELDVDASGCDLSPYAIDNATPGARGHVRVASLIDRLPFDDGAFDVVSVLETLEHLDPADVPRALAELRRVCRGHVLATIPSFGPNQFGPDGWLNAKVPDDRVSDYLDLGPDYGGPIPHADLSRDAEGEPVEGHLTIASFGWWTTLFEAAGFERRGNIELLIHPHLARFGLTKFWNLYVFAAPGAPEPASESDPARLAEVEHRWGLDRRVADPADMAAVQAAIDANAQ